MKQVTAICNEGDDAQRAMDALVEASFPPDDISILNVSGRRVEELPVGQRTGIPITLPIGVAIGVTVGISLTVSGLLPQIGLVSAGPILGLLEGAAIGAAVGTLLGVLAGLGWWKADADIEHEDHGHGGLVVGVSVPDGREDDAVAALRGAGAARVTVA